MGCCITKVKELRDISKIKNVKYEETKVYIPPIKYGYVCKVYDGDTFTIASQMPGSKDIYRFSVRIKGIDCPELRTKDIDEKEIAILAREFAKNLYEETNNIVELREIKYDKYGRLCSHVYVNKKNVSEELLRERLAVEYDGGCKVSPLNWKEYYLRGNNRD